MTDFVPTYLDFNATAPLLPEALAAMQPYLLSEYGNPSSRHEYGRAARRAVDAARESVAAAVGAHPSEVYFTGSGSEANNLLLKGFAGGRECGVMAVSAVEHASVAEPMMQLQRAGWRVETLAVDARGAVDTAQFDGLAKLSPGLVSLMLANNETGVVQDVEALIDTLRSTQAVVHTDAVQAFGKLPLNFRKLGAHAMTLSAHKIGGPKGVGALILDKRLELEPQVAGGGQERGLRSGTENVAALVGFGKACEWVAERVSRVTLQAAARDHLERGLRDMGATIFGASVERLANTSFFAFPAIDGETLVGKLDRAGFAVASGAACGSFHVGHSQVLRAMKVDDELARGAVRVSLGPDTTKEQIDGLLAALRSTVYALRKTASVVMA